MLPLLSKTVILLCALLYWSAHKSATSSAQKNIKGSLTVLHVMLSMWYAGRVAGMPFEAHSELDPGPHSTAGALTHCLLQTRPTVFAELEQRLQCNLQATRADTAAGCCLEPALWTIRPGILGLLPSLAARNQGEGGSRSHLPVPTGCHVRSRLSARLCGKETRIVSIFFHSRHELWPTDKRSWRSRVHPPSSLFQAPEKQRLRGGVGDIASPKKRPAGRKEQEPRTCCQFAL